MKRGRDPGGAKRGSRAEEVPEGQPWVYHAAPRSLTCQPIRKAEAISKALQLLKGEREGSEGKDKRVRGKEPRARPRPGF